MNERESHNPFGKLTPAEFEAGLAGLEEVKETDMSDEKSLENITDEELAGGLTELEDEKLQADRLAESGSQAANDIRHIIENGLPDQSKLIDAYVAEFLKQASVKAPDRKPNESLGVLAAQIEAVRNNFLEKARQVSPTEAQPLTATAQQLEAQAGLLRARAAEIRAENAAKEAADKGDAEVIAGILNRPEVAGWLDGLTSQDYQDEARYNEKFAELNDRLKGDLSEDETVLLLQAITQATEDKFGKRQTADKFDMEEGDIDDALGNLGS